MTNDTDRDHPRLTYDLVGNGNAEDTLLQAFNSDRMHHAWLITGPKGVGKATLAYRFARFLLSQPADHGGASLFGDEDVQTAESLELSADHPVCQRIESGGHGDLVTIEPAFDEKRGRYKSEILIGDVRGLQGFYGKTASEGGWRIAIIDSADELNRNAANAILKILEEPPEKSIILLVSHAPGRLLPTIRSRCRKLALKPLDDQSVSELLMRRLPELAEDEARALAVLAKGSAGSALALAENSGLQVYSRMLKVLGGLAKSDTVALHGLADRLAAPRRDQEYRLFFDLMQDWLARMVAHGVAQDAFAEVMSGEGGLARQFLDAVPLDHWIDLWEKVGELTARADAIHLDRRQVVLDIMLEMRGKLAA